MGQCGVLGAGLPHAWGEARSPSSGEALLPAAGCHHGEGPKSTTAPSQRGFLNKGVLSPSGLICANSGAAGPAVARRYLWVAPGSLQPSCLPCRRLDLHRARGQAGGPVRVPVTGPGSKPFPSSRPPATRRRRTEDKRSVPVRMRFSAPSY